MKAKNANSLWMWIKVGQIRDNRDNRESEEDVTPRDKRRRPVRSSPCVSFLLKALTNAERPFIPWAVAGRKPEQRVLFFIDTLMRLHRNTAAVHPAVFLPLLLVYRPLRIRPQPISCPRLPQSASSTLNVLRRVFSPSGVVPSYMATDSGGQKCRRHRTGDGVIRRVGKDEKLVVTED